MTSTGAGRVECRELDQLGGMLRCFRERRLWTQELLAEHSNVSLNTISEAERGNRTKMHLTTVTMLADALGLAEEDRAAFRAVSRGGRRDPAPLLPLPATSFLGRERAIVEVSALLARPDLRLLTLTGPGGIGKTRLALRVAEAMAPVFADGAHFVDLASVATVDLVPGAMARAVGFVAHGGQPVYEALLDHLAERHLLMVLDNFEHVLDAADYVNRVLIDCPRVMLLVTSRERLGLSREQLYAVGTMSLPDADESTDARTAAGSEAVRLFVERAATVKYGFALTAENLEDVVAICRELDGLPLAIELAAAQMAHVRSAASLRGRLDYRLPWLKGGSRDQTARHRTMRDAIAWSYEALTPADQAMFRRVAVFAGGFTIDTVETAMQYEAGSADNEQIFERVSSLVAKNLLQLYDAPDGGTRYRMLETIREYGLEQLNATGEAEAALRAHGRTFRVLVEQGERELTGSLQNAWMARLESEIDNIRSALTWAIEKRDADTGMRMASALWRFWAASGRIAEGKQLLSDAIATPGEIEPAVHVKALRRLGNLCVELGDYGSARLHFEDSLARARLLDDHIAYARALSSVGFVALNQGAYDEAQTCLEEAITHWNGSDFDIDRAATSQSLGQTALGRFDFGSALEHLQTSAHLRRVHGDEIGAAFAQYWLAQLARFEGDLDMANLRASAALETFRSGSERLGEGNALFELAMQARESNRLERADSLMRDSLECRQAIGDIQGLIESIEGLGVLACDRGEFAAGIRFISAMDGWRADRSMVALAPARTITDRAASTARAHLDSEQFDANWAAGSVLTFRQVRTLTASSINGTASTMGIP